MNDCTANPEDGTRRPFSISLFVALLVSIDDSLVENLMLGLRTFGLERSWFAS